MKCCGGSFWAKLQERDGRPLIPQQREKKPVAKKDMAAIANFQEARRARLVFVRRAKKFQGRLPSGLRKKLADIRDEHAKPLAQEAGYIAALYRRTMADR
jgi:hypothetical protein